MLQGVLQCVLQWCCSENLVLQCVLQCVCCSVSVAVCCSAAFILQRALQRALQWCCGEILFAVRVAGCVAVCVALVLQREYLFAGCFVGGRVAVCVLRSVPTSVADAHPLSPSRGRGGEG